jgi:hypothetical protein
LEFLLAMLPALPLALALALALLLPLQLLALDS